MKMEVTKTMEKYEPPRVEVVEVQVECGFAASVNVIVTDYNNGGSLGDYTID